MKLKILFLKDQRDQFKKYVTNTLGLAYDYNSIMHYGWNYFAVDITKPTILPKVKAAIGNAQWKNYWDQERRKKFKVVNKNENF